MDMTKVGEKAVTLVKKYRYVILVLVLGIGLMSIPTKNKDTKTMNTQPPLIIPNLHI